MTLSFPSLEILIQSLMRGLIPAEIVQSSALLTGDGPMRLVTFRGRLLKKQLDPLIEAGVTKAERAGPQEIGEASNWYQLLPLVKSKTTLEIGTQSEVIFELKSRNDLREIASEMLRLGNDRQRFAELADGRVFCKVVSPPYYTLCRALDGFMTAYLQAKPGLWLQAGYTHPFVEELQVPDGCELLGSVRGWEPISPPEYAEFYNAVTIDVPPPSQEAAGPMQDLLSVTPGFRDVAAKAAPTLWVVNREAVQRFVEDSDSRLIDQLSFAAALSGTIILRALPNQSPVLQMESAAEYAAYWQLNNLFLPPGKQLHPPLRRDIVAKLLADDPEQIVWLEPEAESFRPRRIAENAFRPLSEWVEYVIANEEDALTAWMGSNVFDFASFAVAENSSSTMASAKKAKPTAAASTTLPLPEPEEAEAVAEVSSVVVPVPQASPDRTRWRLHCAELEAEFLSSSAAIDDLQRQPLWAALAGANAELGPERRAETALCAIQAGDAESLRIWKHVESAAGGSAEPDAALLRQTAAEVLTQPEGDELLTKKLQLLEQHDSLLPARIAWEAAKAVSRLKGDDRLSLARARDRLQQRLFENGLRPEKDLPAFLRFAGTANSSEARQVREALPELHRSVRDWTQRGLGAESKQTLAYIDLYFAWGLASLGDASVAATLRENANRVLNAENQPPEMAAAGSFLNRALGYRIDEAVAGNPHSGPLCPPLLNELTDLRNRLEKKEAPASLRNAEYAVARFREHSFILEPQEKSDAQALTGRERDALTRLISELPYQRDGRTLRANVMQMMKTELPGRNRAEADLSLLKEAIPVSLRGGEEFAAELIEAAAAAAAKYTPSGESDAQTLPAVVLSRALRLALFLNRNDTAKRLLTVLSEYLLKQALPAAVNLINRCSHDIFTLLRPKNHRDLLTVFHAACRRVLNTVFDVASPEPEVLRSKVALAAGMFLLDETATAVAVMDAAQNALLSPPAGTASRKAFDLALAYLNALSFAPQRLALDRMSSLFRSFDPRHLAIRLTTHPFFSLHHLGLAEAVVRALAGGDSRAGLECRRWLDDEERSLRELLHRDVESLILN